MTKIVVYIALTDLSLEAQKEMFSQVYNDKPIKVFIEPKKSQWSVLSEAIKYTIQKKALLVIPKLGRLVSNVRITKVLKESGVHFKCMDKPEVNSTTIQMYAALAWETSLKASRLKKEKFAQLRESGVKLASADPNHWKGRDKRKAYALKASKVGAKKRSNYARQAYSLLLPTILKLTEEAKKQQVEKRGRGKHYPIYETVANQLNEAGHRTVYGTIFNNATVYRIIQRYAHQ